MPSVVPKEALLVVDRLATMLVGGAGRRVDAQQVVGNVVFVIREGILFVGAKAIAFVAEFHIERMLEIGEYLLRRVAIAKTSRATDKATACVEVVKRPITIEIDALLL